MTKVKFLLEKVGGGVFAYFPELIFDSSDNMTSYSHIGQHSACHPDYANSCKEANESQYKDLLKELEGQGYDDLIVINDKESRSKFVICPDIMRRDKGRGFQMTFDNGNTISVMFGYGNYCDNRNGLKVVNDIPTCENAEIAIWNDSGDWYNFGSDTVKGYLSTNDVAKWIEFASSVTF